MEIVVRLLCVCEECPEVECVLEKTVRKKLDELSTACIRPPRECIFGGKVRAHWRIEQVKVEKR